MSYIDTDKIVVSVDKSMVSKEVINSIKLFVRNFYSPECELAILSIAQSDDNIDNIDDYIFIINGHKFFYAKSFKRKLIIYSLDKKWVNDVDIDLAQEKSEVKQ